MLVIIVSYQDVAPDAFGPFKTEEDANLYAKANLELPPNINLLPDDTWRHPTTKIKITINYLLPPL